ncbi:MAG: hypothetical protein ACTSRI_17320 [Promethearchaeota archaeon]
MEKKAYYKYMFIIGAIWNWINSLSFIGVSIIDSSVFSIMGTSYPPTLFFLHSLLGLIFTYGVGYYIVGRDINKNHGIVTLGIISKLLFFMFCVIYFLLGDINVIIVVLGFGDFVFALLFIEFLIGFKKI